MDQARCCSFCRVLSSGNDKPSFKEFCLSLEVLPNHSDSIHSYPLTTKPLSSRMPSSSNLVLVRAAMVQQCDEVSTFIDAKEGEGSVSAFRQRNRRPEVTTQTAEGSGKARRAGGEKLTDCPQPLLLSYPHNDLTSRTSSQGPTMTKDPEADHADPLLRDISMKLTTSRATSL